MSRRIHVRRCVSTRPALPDGLRDMWSGKGIAVLSRAMRRDRELRKNRRQKQRYVLLRASSASSNAFNSAQCLVCLTIIALRRSVSLSTYSRSSRAWAMERTIRKSVLHYACAVIDRSYRCLTFVEASVSWFLFRRVPSSTARSSRRGGPVAQGHHQGIRAYEES